MANSAINSIPVSQDKILQTVQTLLTDTTTLDASSLTDVTDGTTTMAATITPSSTSNKILILGNLICTPATSTTSFNFKLYNGTSYLNEGTASGSRLTAFLAVGGRGTGSFYGMGRSVPIYYLDSPNTTSAITYTVRCVSPTGIASLYINRNVTDTDSTNFYRYVSTLTLIEIKG